MDVLDLVWTQLNKDLEELRRSVLTLTARSERSEQANGVQVSAWADTPLAERNSTTGDLLWISDGRKTGEGVGAGTGVLCYFNPTTNTWKRVRDDVDVAV